MHIIRLLYGWNEMCRQTNHHHNLGHHHNLIRLYNLFHQLTAKLKIGPRGLTAAQPAEVEPRREEGELFKKQRMEEFPVQLWKKKSLATLTNAKVFFVLMTQTNSKLTSIPTHLQLRSLMFANGPTGHLVTSSATHRESQTRHEKRRTAEMIWTKVCPF